MEHLFIQTGALDEESLNVSVRNVEVYNGREISFMTEKAIALLRELSDEMMFVPVTTRTVEQYNRVSLFHDEIRPTYAITCNGGVVLKDGQYRYALAGLCPY